jgi:hypothetical protein
LGKQNLHAPQQTRQTAVGVIPGKARLFTKILFAALAKRTFHKSNSATAREAVAGAERCLMTNRLDHADNLMARNDRAAFAPAARLHHVQIRMANAAGGTRRRMLAFGSGSGISTKASGDSSTGRGVWQGIARISIRKGY